MLDSAVGTPLYLGIMTDTGSFRFPSVSPETHETLAKLMRAGVKHYEIYGPLFFGSVTAFTEKFDIKNDPSEVVIDFAESRTRAPSHLQSTFHLYPHRLTPKVQLYLVSS